MNNIKKLCLFLFCLSLLAVLCFSYSYTLAQTDSTIVVVPVNVDVHSGSQPYIAGQTAANTEVMVYFDDKFADLAVNSDTSDPKIKNFYYAYSNSNQLKPGTHKVTLIARNKTNLVKSPTLLVKDIVIPSLPAPTIFEPTNNSFNTSLRPLIKGATWSGTHVNIFIDGYLKYRSAFLVSNNGTAKFEYQVPANLAYGWHTVYAYSDNLSNDQSLISNTINFRVEKPMVAPTLRSVSFSVGKLKIEGVAPSESHVNIYIDNLLASSFQTSYHKSGVVGFMQSIKPKLNKGRHVVCLTATDKRGKVSVCSKKFAFNVSVPTITKEAAVENGQETVASDSNKQKSLDSDHDGLTDYDEINVYKTNPKKADTDGDGYSDKTEIDHGYSPLITTKKDPKYLDKLEKMDSDKDGISDYLEIYKYKTNPKKADTDGDGYSDKTEIDNGFSPLVISSKDKKKVVSAATVAQLAKLEVNKAEQQAIKSNIETKQTGNETIATTTNTQGASIGEIVSNIKKINLNLAIFVIFVIGIIIWITWVNRELIKERSRQNREESTKEEIQDDPEN